MIHRFYNQRFLCDYEMAWLVKIYQFVKLIDYKWNTRLIQLIVLLIISFSIIYKIFLILRNNIHSHHVAISLIQLFAGIPQMFNNVNSQNTNNILFYIKSKNLSTQTTYRCPCAVHGQNTTNILLDKNNKNRR